MIKKITIDRIANAVSGLLDTYAKEIDTAMAEEGTLSISLPVKIKQDGPKLDVEVGIGFIKEKVKDTIGFTVTEQKELFRGDQCMPL